MLFLVVEHFEPGVAPAIYRRLAERGRGLPPGVEYLDSWVALDFGRCFQLMRADDASKLEPWVEFWSDLGRFEIVAVQTSADAARSMASLPGGPSEKGGET